MFNPYCFTDRTLNVGFNITLHSHQDIHSISKLILKPNCIDFEFELQYK